jgi:hypothetical protein
MNGSQRMTDTTDYTIINKTAHAIIHQSNEPIGQTRQSIRKEDRPGERIGQTGDLGKRNHRRHKNLFFKDGVDIMESMFPREPRDGRGASSERELQELETDHGDGLLFRRDCSDGYWAYSDEWF